MRRRKAPQPTPRGEKKTRTNGDETQPSGGDEVNSLPLDLLGYIFSLVAAGPRLRILTLVCKRWRDAVRRSITSLKLACDERCKGNNLVTSFDDIGVLFPALTELTLRTNDTPLRVRLPTKLAKLYLRPDFENYQQATEAFSFAEPLPRLSLLSFSTQGGGPPGSTEYYIPLMEHCVSSLTSLILTGIGTTRQAASLVALLEKTYFPALTELSLNLGFLREQDIQKKVGPFLQRHACQLSVFKLRKRSYLSPTSDVLQISLGGASFPQLTVLSLDIDDCPPASLLALLGQCSCLKDLTLSATLLTTEHFAALKERNILGLITKILYQWEVENYFEESMDPSQYLPSLCNVREIKEACFDDDEDSSRFATYIIESNFAHLVTGVYYLPPAPALFHYSMDNFSNITVMWVNTDDLVKLTPLPKVKLMKMRKLKIGHADLRFEKVIIFLQQFVRACPNLAKIEVDELVSVSTSDLRKLSKLLQKHRNITLVRLAAASIASDSYSVARQEEASCCARISLIMTESQETVPQMDENSEDSNVPSD